MAGQQICLKWNSFQTNIVTSFENLWEEEGLVDVTLASDGQCIRAHKVILSACSPFFRRVFQSNPCQHPVIILQDVHFSELESLLCFVYKGEVNIGQESLPALLKAAETLQIRGLSGASEQVKEKMAVPRKTHPSECPSEASLHPPAKRHRGCSSPIPSIPTHLEHPPTSSSSPPSTPPLALTAKTEGHEESVQVPPCGGIEAGVAEEILRDADGEISCTPHGGGGTDSMCGGDDEDEDYGEEDQPLAHLSLKMEPPEFDCGGDSNSLPLALTLTLPNASEEMNIPSVLAKARRSSDCRMESSQIKGLVEPCAMAEKIPAQVEVTPIPQCSSYPATPFPCPFCERTYTSWGFRRRHIKAVHAFTSPLQLSCKWCPKPQGGSMIVNNGPVQMSVPKWERHVMDKHGITAAEVQSSLEILEEAHMVLQIAEPLRLASISAGVRVNNCGKDSKNLTECDEPRSCDPEGPIRSSRKRINVMFEDESSESDIYRTRNDGMRQERQNAAGYDARYQ